MKDKKLIYRKARVSDLSKLQLMSAALIDSDNRYDNFQMQRQWSLGDDGKKYLLRRIRGRKGVCFVAEIDNDVVGYITGGLTEIQKWRPFKRTEVDNIFVVDGYRGKNIGGELLKIFEEWSIKMDAEKMLLYAMSGNEKAIQFYVREGFGKFNYVMEKTI